MDTGAELTLGEYGIYQRCFGNKGNNVQAVQQQQFIKFLRDLHEVGGCRRVHAVAACCLLMCC